MWLTIMLMTLFRKAGAWLAVSMLPFLLFGLATNFALLRSVGSPQPIKQTLEDSRIYGSTLDAVLEATDNPNDDGQPGGIRPDNPVVREAAKKAFPPELLQGSAENFIDALYGWLEGETPTPQFRIDLTQAKATFINEIAAGAQAQAASLPPCPRGQTQFGDPFAATCLPRGLPPSAAADKIRQELGGGDEKFLKDPVITADTFKTKGGEPVFSNTSPLPENFQRIQKLPIILSVLAAVAISTIIFLSASRQMGLKRVGITLLIVGASLLLFAWITNRLVNSVVAPKVEVKNVALQPKLRTLVEDLSGNISKDFMVAGGAYAALGTAAVSGAIYLGRRNRPNQAELAHDHATDGQPGHHGGPKAKT